MLRIDALEAIISYLVRAKGKQELGVLLLDLRLTGREGAVVQKEGIMKYYT